VPKEYEVQVKHPLDEKQVHRLLAGVVLDAAPKPVKAQACSAEGEFHLKLTLTEGKYHQVKRMVAAVGNRVEALHRSSVGVLSLTDGLMPGHWRWLTGEEVTSLTGKASG
jgi:16S rRNA pseudouridine516 synthase